MFQVLYNTVAVTHSYWYNFPCIQKDKFFSEFDLGSLPIDLRPVQYLVGRWELEQMVGEGQQNFIVAHVIEFGIDPLPAFGARALNYT